MTTTDLYNQLTGNFTITDSLRDSRITPFYIFGTNTITIAAGEGITDSTSSGTFNFYTGDVGAEMFQEAMIDYLEEQIDEKIDEPLNIQDILLMENDENIKNEDTRYNNSKR